MAGPEFDSAYSRRATIAKFLGDGVIDSRVIDALVVDGLAVNDEAVMWDFKRTVPVAPQAKLNEALKRDYDCKLAEIVKDAVAFYNTHGGYLIIGIDDATRRLIGFSGEFDAADLNKRIQGATGTSVETVFRLISLPTPTQCCAF